MSHIHTAEAGAVFLVEATSGDHRVYLGCFTHDTHDTDATVEASWDSFAKQMWSWGLEPVSDEPDHTTEEDGRVFDHYMLREIRAEF
jgi:hypothetical protein